MKWGVIRVSEETLGMLKEIREYLISNANLIADSKPGEISITSGSASKKDEFGVDRVIRYLIRERKRHYGRSKKARQLKNIKSKRAPVGAVGVPVLADGEVDLPGQTTLDNYLEEPTK